MNQSPDPTRQLRAVVAMVAPLGALAIAASRLVAPYPADGDAATILTEITAHPDAASALAWLRLAATLFLLPGVVVASLAALRRAPRLATAALLVSVPAWSAALAFPDVDGVAHALSATGADPAQGAAVLDHLINFEGGAASAGVALFVFGHIIGTVLAGVALYRSGAVPRWVGTALAVSQPLHFVAFVVLANRWLDAAAYGLTALGFGAAGVAYWRAGRTGGGASPALVADLEKGSHAPRPRRATAALRMSPLAVGAFLFLPACGGDDRLSRAEFVAQANALCTATSERIAALFAEPPAGGQPTPLQTAFDGTVSASRDAIAAFRRLQAPSELSADVRAFLAEAERATDTMQAQGVAYFETPDNPWEPMNVVARRIGIDACVNEG